MTKVCKFCRDAHQKKVKLQGDTTTLSAIAMNRVVSCEACGSPVSLREMDKHLKGHNHDISKIPGVARPGELAEN